MVTKDCYAPDFKLQQLQEFATTSQKLSSETNFWKNGGERHIIMKEINYNLSPLLKFI